MANDKSSVDPMAAFLAAGGSIKKLPVGEHLPNAWNAKVLEVWPQRTDFSAEKIKNRRKYGTLVLFQKEGDVQFKYAVYCKASFIERLEVGKAYTFRADMLNNSRRQTLHRAARCSWHPNYEMMSAPEPLATTDFPPMRPDAKISGRSVDDLQNARDQERRERLTQPAQSPRTRRR